jgi:CDP-glucose 4,6-dehydratase
MTPSFWLNKRIFLTGHTGFKGSWLSLWLESLGSTVTGFSLDPPTTPSLYEAAKVGKGLDSVAGDIRNLQALQKAMQTAKPEIVIHLAAQSLVRQSCIDPVDTYATNVMGSVHLLESVRQTPGVKAVINVTTDKCYDNRQSVWSYRENEPMGGNDPYSNSKGCAELVSKAYRSTFFSPRDYSAHGVAVATARSGNVIGGGDWAKDRLIPDILAAYGSDQPATLNNPFATLPWQHVLEPLRGYLTLAEHLYNHGSAFAEAWNFGPDDGDAQSVEWIATELAARWGKGAKWQAGPHIYPRENSYLKLDISKARSRLKWHPELRLGNALDLVVAWTQQRLQGADIRAVTIEQIQTYQKLVAT